MADGVGSSSCNTSVHGVTPAEVPLASGNAKFVANSSEFTRFKTLSSINLIIMIKHLVATNTMDLIHLLTI